VSVTCVHITQPPTLYTNLNHKDSSQLEELPIDITSTFLLKYMHNIRFGVMKKPIVFWVKGKKPVRLVDPNAVSEEFINPKCYILHSEFNHLPRPLEKM